MKGGVRRGERVKMKRSLIEPSQYFKNLLFKFLNSEIGYNGTVKFGACTNSNEIFKFSSPPFSLVLRHLLEVSDNLYAEFVCKLTGVQTNSSLDTYDAGLLETRRILTSALNVSGDSFYQDDGSGLSRHNLLSPQSLVQVLEAMNGEKEYKSFLPVSCQSGTLSNRFVGTKACGRVHAKTGSMGGVSSLSGYVDNVSFGEIVFSIIINNANRKDISSTIDSIVLLLANLEPC